MGRLRDRQVAVGHQAAARSACRQRARKEPRSPYRKSLRFQGNPGPIAVLHRGVKNQRLAAVGYNWAFSAITASPGARAHYDRRKTDGDRHAAAQRNLFGRLLGCRHHCLATGQHYDETTAFPGAAPATRAAA
jgi:hypothetical protein